jgi:hypothetical protein
MQSEIEYLGLVVNKDDGSLLAQSQVDGRPRTSHILELLTTAMQRPLTGEAHRPSRLHVRGRHQWEEAFPLLEEVGVSVSVRQELPKVKSAFEHHLKQMRNARR